VSGSFVDHFAAVSSDYAAFRPSYPAQLFAWLAGVAPARRLAWDCATGTGQAAVALAAHFERVIATDASRAQLERAVAHARVEYREARAEQSGLDSGSVDLVTVAQALHWFDTPRFFAEARRVLKTGGVLAVWTYGPLQVAGPEVDAVVQRFYHQIVGPYWPAERALVDSGYRSIHFPFESLAAPAFRMAASWALGRLLGYLGTWSATARYREALGRDPIEAIREPLAAAWGSPGREREVVWPLTLRAVRC
jgi:SAM-dependent methyltransferase